MNAAVGADIETHFQPAHDAFHKPFPSAVEEQIFGPFVPGQVARHAVTHTEDPLFRLPTELSDLILSHLSPAALDAARLTCWLWRQKILSHHWLLSEVITRTPPPPHILPAVRLCESEPGEYNLLVPIGSNREPTLRDLLKKFDQHSSLKLAYPENGDWQIRFRIRSLQFSTTELVHLSPHVSTLIIIAAARVGLREGFMILQTVSSTRLHLPENHQWSTLMFFRFDSADFPTYVGSAELPGVVDALDFINMAESKSKRSWIFKIGVGDQLRYLSINVRSAFSKFDTRYMVHLTDSEPLDIPLGEPFSYSLGKISQTCFQSNRSLKLLVSFPDHLPLSCLDCSQKEVYQHDEPRYLAEHVSSGNVIVVKAYNPQDASVISTDGIPHPKGETGSFEETLILAVLVRPWPDSTYKNIAMAPISTMHQTIRVAIIWQEGSQDTKRSELYVYDLPEVICRNSCRSSHGHTDCFQQWGDTGDLAAGLIISGKRVTSLTRRVGGIHPCSPIWDSAASHAAKRDLQKEAALGGLQLPHAAGKQPDFPSSFQYQRCFVWGPADISGTAIVECKVFDFSFADPNRFIHAPNGMPISLARMNGIRHMTRMSLHCACPLHDELFWIVLPSNRTPGARSESAPPQTDLTRPSLFWPWKFKSTTKFEEDLPSITRIDSPEKREALERRQQWFRDRIKDMKTDGMTDFRIAEAWARSGWTEYGQIRKPDGWQDL